MSATNSNIGKYNFDIVVATTEDAVNATMQEYLYNTIFQPVKMYWNQDPVTGNPVPVSYDDLMKQTNGTDPLLVPSWNSGDPMTQDIQNINNSLFYFAFEAAIGVPATMLPSAIPPIVTLNPNSNSVDFTLICSEFTVVTCTFGRSGMTSLFNESQADNDPWLFTSNVPLASVINNTNLPQDVQDQLNNFGPTAFSVQQLFFDLDNAGLQSTPTISGVDPGTPLYTALQQVFVGAYFNEMKTAGQPILNYSIVANTNTNVPPSTFTLTNMEMQVSAYSPANDPGNSGGTAEPGLNSLNYLGVINHNTLPPSTQFPWNWINLNEASTYNGVVSIQSGDFVDWMNTAFSPSLNQIAMIPDCKCWDENWIQLYYSFSFAQDPSPQNYVVSNPYTTGTDGFTTVLTYNYSQYSGQDGGSPWYGVWGNLQCTYTANSQVAVKGNQIRIKAYANAFMHVNVEGGVTEGNFASYTSEVLYTLAVDQYGSLTTGTPSITVTDNSEEPDISGWSKFMTLGTVNSMIEEMCSDLQGILEDFMGDFNTQISAVISSPQTFVFPGGYTFTFKDVAFSDSQDLVSHINYVQP